MSRCILLLIGIMAFLGCSEPEDMIRQKLEFILADDLKTIVEEIRQNDTSAVLDKPFYRITEYANFENSRMFNRKAVVEFYYFRTIEMNQVRKYRYSPTMRQWQRYFKAVEYNLSPTEQKTDD